MAAKETQYVAYYRVSTDSQGVSGLGLEAQRGAVRRFICGRGELLAEFTEVESGKRHKNRPQLLAALSQCESRRAVLVIAKLDRLARNVAFIANLMNSKTQFVAVDMPAANRLTMHILAAVAEHERDMISQRTKDALAAAKARGTRLGNPRAKEMVAAARDARNIPPVAPESGEMIAHLYAQGASWRGIAREMNQLALPTPLGRKWHGKTVKSYILSTLQSAQTAQFRLCKTMPPQTIALKLSSKL